MDQVLTFVISRIEDSTSSFLLVTNFEGRN